MSEETLTHHKSMFFNGGSQVFCVGQKLFQIPKALLAMHSEVFRAMADLPESTKAPIKLQDSEDDFAVFCDVIMMPLESCLFKDDPDLVEVLRVLTIAHKYCATTLEEVARCLAIQLTRHGAIYTHLTPHLTSLHIVELAKTAHCDEVAWAAWDVAMREFRRRRREMHEILSLTDRIGDPQYIGKAYYHAMLRG